VKVKCVECNREFDLIDEDDAQEWYYGHDCEVD
jgi:DNA-directed RNA polymerase subunit RPC12/RpoP